MSKRTHDQMAAATATEIVPATEGAGPSVLLKEPQVSWVAWM